MKTSARRYTFSAYWLAAIVQLLTACGSDLAHDAPFDPDSPVTKQARGAVSGRFMLENENDAAQIAVKLEGKIADYQASTGKDGTFAIKNVVPGIYRWTATSRYFSEAQGELTVYLGRSTELPAVQLSALRTGISGSALSKLVNGATEVTRGGLLVRLTRTGPVASVSSSPIAPRVVAGVAVPTTGRRLSFSTLSDAAGAWALADVPSGTYDVEASDAEAHVTTIEDVVVTGEQPVAVEAITLAPLTGFFRIVGTAGNVESANFTNTATVTLELTGLNATQMEIGAQVGGACIYDPPVPLAALAAFVLPAQGVNIVCVRYGNASGERTNDLLEAINYDAQAPALQTLAFVSHGGYTDTAVGILQFGAGDENSGLAALQWSPTPAGVTAAAPLPFSPALVVPLNLDGLNQVWARVIDAAGNPSVIQTAAVIRDLTPPSVTGLTLASGAPLSASNIVRADIATSDSSITEMQFSEDPAFSGAAWTGYQPSSLVALSITNGPKTVYLRTRDALKRTSNIVSAGLALDTQPPAQLTASFAWAATNTASAALRLAAVDNLDAYADLQVRITGAELSTVDGAAENVGAYLAASPTRTLAFTGTGLKTVSVTFRDRAGNESLPAMTSLTIDQAGPAGSVTLQGAQGDNRRASLSWSAVNGAAFYRIEAAKNHLSGAFTATEPIVTVADTHAVVTGLDNGYSYGFRVRSYDAVGNPDASWSNVLVAPVGTVSRTIDQGSLSNHLQTMALDGNAVLFVSFDSNGGLVLWKSADNGRVWTRKTVATGFGNADHARIVVSGGQIVVAATGAAHMKIYVSNNGGESFTAYNLNGFNWYRVGDQFRRPIGLASDGRNYLVSGNVSSRAYAFARSNGAGSGAAWSAPGVLGNPTTLADEAGIESTACMSSRLAVILHQSPTAGLWSSVSKNGAASFTNLPVDTLTSNHFQDLACAMDSRGTTYAVYEETDSKALVLSQLTSDAGWVRRVLPRTLPNNATGAFGNPHVWASEAGTVYVSFYELNTLSVWLATSTDEGRNWRMQQIDNAPTAGLHNLLAGAGGQDFRLLYDINDKQTLRFIGPALPAPAKFEAKVGFDDAKVTTAWAPPIGLDTFAVYSSVTSAPPYANAVLWTGDTLAYPANGTYYAVASRDAYGPGNLSDRFKMLPGRRPGFLGAVSGVLDASMAEDGLSGYTYVAVTTPDPDGTMGPFDYTGNVWLTAVAADLTNGDWVSIADADADMRGVDVKAHGDGVYLVYCNVFGTYFLKSTNRGATFGAPLELKGSNNTSIVADKCALDIWLSPFTGAVAAIRVAAVDEGYLHVIKADNDGTSFALGANTGVIVGLQGDLDIDIEDGNPNNQLIGYADWDLAPFTHVVKTNNDWSAGSLFHQNTAGYNGIRVAADNGMAYALTADGPYAGVMYFSAGAIDSNTYTEGPIDSASARVGALGARNGVLYATYTAASNSLRVASCVRHCTASQGWTRTAVHSIANDVAIPVGAVSAQGGVSYGVIDGFGDNPYVRIRGVMEPVRFYPSIVTGGLLGTYYNSGASGFASRARAQIDPQIDFNWGAAAPAGVAADYFNVVWSGYVYSNAYAWYYIDLLHDDGARVIFNGATAIDNWGNTGTVTDSYWVFLWPGWFPITIAYRETTGNAQVKLSLRQFDGVDYPNYPLTRERLGY